MTVPRMRSRKKTPKKEIEHTECAYCLELIPSPVELNHTKEECEKIQKTNEQVAAHTARGISNYHADAIDLANLIVEKQKSYGNSVVTSPQAFELLYPNGIPVEKYGDALTLVRIWDKMMRIANNKDAFNEDPYNDIAGYALLALNKD